MTGRRRDTSRDYPVDPSVKALADHFVEYPQGLIRDGLVQRLAEAIQHAIEDFFTDLERA